MTPRPENPFFYVYLSALFATAALSIDFYLPSLPYIGRTLAADTGLTQLTLSAFMAGFAVAQLIIGPLGDRFGRRAVLLGGLVVYTGASLVCAMAISIEMLIAARILQALGAASAVVMARAVVRDVAEGKQAAALLAHLASIMALVPALAPMVGGVMQDLTGWRSLFVIMACIGTGLFTITWRGLPETLPPDRRQSFRPGAVLAGYRILLTNRTYTAYVLTICFVFGGMFAFIAGSSFLFQDYFGFGPTAYGASFGFAVIGFLSGTWSSRRLSDHMAIDRIATLGILFAVTGGVLMAGFVVAGVIKPATILAPMLIYMAGAGLAIPQSAAGALTPFPERAGTASALMGFLQFLSATATGAFVGHSVSTNPAVLVYTIAVMAVCALATFAIAGRFSLFRQPPVSDTP